MRTVPQADQLLESLDPEQREVALQVAGPLMVRAGAGTGKTRAITYRIAYAVASDVVDPRSVMAVTFTQRAAAELKSRLSALNVDGVSARTFHSAALRQLTYFWPYAIGGNIPPIKEHKSALVAAACTRLGLRVGKALVRDLAAEIEWAKVSMLNPEQYASNLVSFGRTPPADLDPTTMANLLSLYEDAKDEAGVIDFEDVLTLLTGILRERGDIAARVRNQYRYFVVDEFQDVSRLQFELLQEWIGQRHDLCVVGDVAQTIYSFAGANPQYLTDFKHYHPGAREVVLHRNYRSTPQIVSLANHLWDRKDDRRDMTPTPSGIVQLVAQRDSGPAVQFSTYADDEAQAQAVAETIKLLHADGEGVKLKDLAVLFRTNAQSAPFEQALRDVGISYQVRGAMPFFERPEVRRAILILRQSAKIAPPSGSKPAPAGQVAQTVATILESVGWTPTPPQTAGATREEWEGMQTLVELARSRNWDSLEDFVADLVRRAQNQHEPTLSAVTLCSLHAAKGLEWDTVFLVGVSDGLIPISLAKTTCAVAEEERLLYVGITRAQTSLRLSYSLNRAGARTKLNQPSRFLRHLWPLEDAPARPTQAAPTGRNQREELQAQLDARQLHILDELRQWRSQVAASRTLPPYRIFTDLVLTRIAHACPTTTTQLRLIRGVGDHKLDTYGAAVLTIVRKNNPSRSNDHGTHGGKANGSVPAGD